MIEIDKTDETCSITNTEFLRAIFGNNTNSFRPILTSVKGNPNQASKSEWFGHPYDRSIEVLFSHDANNYFSLAQFNPDETRIYRRQKKQFHTLNAIMLDDIGTKVAIDRLVLSPSWLLETSPGNFQAGYILAEPITISKEADQLMNSLLAADLSDKGCNGVTARLARLPIGANGKYDPFFPCRLRKWEPEQRYSVQELVNAFELNLLESSSKKQKGERNKHLVDESNEQIWTPCPMENAVISILKTRNLYKSPLGENKHDITCPWVHEHTDAVDHGTAYFEPNDNYPIGGFKCHHGHCTERHMRDLLEFLDVSINVARMKPTIRVVSGEMHRVIDAAERALADTQQYYQRGGLIVSVHTDPSTKETLIKDIPQAALSSILCGTASWEKYDNRKQNMIRIDPPPKYVTALFGSNNYQHLPVIDSLAHHPYLQPNGDLMVLAGYDSETGMFGVFDARKFSIPENPTREDAETALLLLKDLISEFRFATESDKSAAFCAMLTSALRPSLNHAPMFHVHAHAVGSGKSYLCELITAFATPQRGAPTTFPTDDDECRKLLLSEFLRAPAVIEFDNLTSDILPHKSLCTALTSEFMSGRILGASKTATVSTRVLFLSSGNNVVPIQDMTRRCVTISLNPEFEIPAMRTYTRPNLIDEVLQQRGKYLSAALTIVRAWIVFGKPKSECKPLAGFGNWSDYTRQPLLWLGLSDPASSILEAIKTDPDRELVGRLLKRWYAIFNNKPTMVRELVLSKPFSSDENSNELYEVIHEIAGERGEINRRRLGWWIKRQAGKIIDGFRLVKCQGNTSSERWRVEPV